MNCYYFQFGNIEKRFDLEMTVAFAVIFAGTESTRGAILSENTKLLTFVSCFNALLTFLFLIFLSVFVSHKTIIQVRLVMVTENIPFS